MSKSVISILIYVGICVLSFVLTAVMEHFAIPKLHEMKFGQFVRDDGPESHLKKSGTPTMGGVCMLISVFISTVIGVIILYSLLDAGKSGLAIKQGFISEVVMILLLTLGYGIVGFLDDYLKIKHKQSMGLRAWQKMLLQIVITGIFIFLHITNSNMYNTPADVIIIPFTAGKTFMFPVWLFVIFAFFVLLGTDNGTNLTDGLDGLLSFVTIPVTLVLWTIAYKQFDANKDIYKAVTVNGAKADADIYIVSAVMLVSAAMLGALIGFLIYNHYPAKVFMGDTGSLMVGGYVASCAMLMNVSLFILLFGFVYLMETISVILQVGYFKISGGKRIFKMAPIHHHFEQCGWKEVKVVTVFSIVSLICCIIGFLAYR
ncbi:MAG: phospho-N-acetylmuramoyl-pentapeptide-transferase [Lachnospiraceae bacterium]|nr:phospho-N-acetylmuramoyl-pentapeptide-transferase [Lachnospiraceae bacterium]